MPMRLPDEAAGQAETPEFGEQQEPRERLAEEVGSTLHQFLRGLGLFDIAVGPLYIALVYGLYFISGMSTGLWVSSKLPEPWGSALLPFAALGGGVAYIVLAMFLRRFKIRGFRLGIVGLLLAWVLLITVVALPKNAVDYTEIQAFQYDRCLDAKERNLDLTDGCRRILAEGDASDSTGPVQRSQSGRKNAGMIFFAAGIGILGLGALGIGLTNRPTE